MSLNEQVPSEVGRSLIRVLIVHPTRVERVRLIRPLRTRFGRNVEVLEAKDVGEAEDLLANSFFDVALVAQNLEGLRGLDLAGKMAEISPETATLLIADEDAPELAAEVAQSAACDYVVRGKIDEHQLAKAISGAIRQIHLQRDYREMVRRINESHDQLDHLIRALSHDMNANFMLMENSFGKLQRSLETNHSDDVDLKEVASHVRACMTESRRFLNDLVGLARTGRVEMEPEMVDTERVVEEVLFEQHDFLAERDVVAGVWGRLPRLWCNRHRLKQVITNLIRNAVKHGMDPTAPRLTIRGGGTCGATGMAVLQIHDNGPGIPPEWREEIFMPGRRGPGAKTEGSGMGLAIVRKIVSHYGGSIRVDSGPQGGTTFEIELPSVGDFESDPECPSVLGSDQATPADRRFDHDSPHEDPRLHSHSSRSRRPEPGRRFSGSDG